MGLDDKDNGSLLLPFDKVRTPSSKGSLEIQSFLVEQFSRLNQDWRVEAQEFQENGHNFTNLIFSLGTNNSVLAIGTHYDSKFEPAGFVGAIDSAAPCAVALYVAKFIDYVLTEDEGSLEPILKEHFTGIKIIFFDGEEAIHEWTRTDSLYGSRFAANKWEKEGSLQWIDLLVVLDLLGGDEPITIPSYYPETNIYFNMIAEVERSYNLYHKVNHRIFGSPVLSGVKISDDHEPFVERGIKALHLIPFPFPSQWHREDDTFSRLDSEHVHKWCVMMCEFLIRYWRSKDNLM